MTEDEERRVSHASLQKPLESKKGRENWSNKREFFLSCLGYSIGYGNIWRFPYLCYKNGGAAFLIPYYIINLCAGLPLTFMEHVIGQYTSLGPFVLFNKLAPIFSGVGWSLIMICFLAALLYNMIISWCFFYLFASFSSPLPWSHCDNDFNSAECFSNADAALCMNQSLYYFNRTCLSVDDYCRVAQLTEHNFTHCYHDDEDGPILADGLLPKISSAEDYFKNRVLGVRGKSWDNMGKLRWELVGCQVLAWCIVASSLVKGIKSLGKVVYVTATFPYLILAILFVRSITLDGAYQGIEFYLLKPNITKLTEAEVWSDGAIQVFYSNAIGIGTLINLAAYNKFNNNCMRDATVISVINSSTSVFAGFVIFGILGFLAKELNVRVDEVASSGSGLVFVVYPAALALLPVPQLWSILFFLMLINLGIGTQISAVETLTAAVSDQFEFLRSKKAYVSFVTCFVSFLLSLTMCLEGGILMFELFFWYAAALGLIITGLVQLLSIQFFYGYKRFLGNVKEMGIHIPRLVEYYLTIAWTITSPLLLMIISFFYIYYYVPAYWGDHVFPTSIQILGWFLNLASMGCIPIGMVIACCRKGQWRDSMKISEDFCPASVRKLRRDLREKDDDLPKGAFQYASKTEALPLVEKDDDLPKGAFQYASKTEALPLVGLLESHINLQTPE